MIHLYYDSSGYYSKLDSSMQFQMVVLDLYTDIESDIESDNILYILLLDRITRFQILDIRYMVFQNHIYIYTYGTTLTLYYLVKIWLRHGRDDHI